MSKRKLLEQVCMNVEHNVHCRTFDSRSGSDEVCRNVEHGVHCLTCDSRSCGDEVVIKIAPPTFEQKLPEKVLKIKYFSPFVAFCRVSLSYAECAEYLYLQRNREGKEGKGLSI